MIRKSVFGGIVLLMGVFFYLMVGDESLGSKKVKEVIALGDSLTYGYGDASHEGYTGKLEEKLNHKYRNRIYDIQNYGIIGQESSQVMQQLIKPSLSEELNEADYFILFIGTNDLINSNGGDLAPIYHNKIMKSKKEYLENLEAIIDNLESSNYDAPILLLGLYNPYPQGEKIEQYIDNWNQSIKKMAIKNSRIVYIPMNDVFKGKDKKEYFYDSLHPNRKGYELISNRIEQKYHF
ncbi:lysophospholipase L1-like esterase [Bacillus pakistanensis]|uniref:Lysophospholipase L1-like esterase n=1 Tax=Rossellomorea pakistanensis TaxID=992288 RepID=A0ABS2NGN9_9BACI|nr:GDSL-type esterase/lipase family protein [Bacillus pakistanensis]MBM7586994.1 lysophospholipase L1-like esterase [Bacillus pakistanensis]